MSTGEFFLPADRLPDQLDGLLRVPGLQGNDSEEMQRVKVVRLLLQNFPIEALRVRKVSLPMQRHCLRKLGLHDYRSRMLSLWLGITSFGHWCFPNRSVKRTLVGIVLPPHERPEIVRLLKTENRHTKITRLLEPQ